MEHSACVPALFLSPLGEHACGRSKKYGFKDMSNYLKNTLTFCNACPFSYSAKQSPTHRGPWTEASTLHWRRSWRSCICPLWSTTRYVLSLSRLFTLGFYLCGFAFLYACIDHLFYQIVSKRRTDLFGFQVLEENDSLEKGNAAHKIYSSNIAGNKVRAAKYMYMLICPSSSMHWHCSIVRLLLMLMVSSGAQWCCRTSLWDIHYSHDVSGKKRSEAHIKSHHICVFSHPMVLPPVKHTYILPELCLHETLTPF